jgi:riboflavin synthase
MFTGLVEGMGTVSAVTPKGGDVELTIDTGGLGLGDTGVGASISVSGACLTVTRIAGTRFSADLSKETLARTTLGASAPGRRVNLERPLRAGQPLGGHYVTGHIDGVGRVIESEPDARSIRLTFEAPDELARYVVAKGSVTVDGVSLTVNHVSGARFGVYLIPHTALVTTLGALRPGDEVNIEVDILARYVESLLGSFIDLHQPRGKP